MNISIVGTGYVGLVTGACFAEKGNTVWCVDIDNERIENLKQGVLPVFEPGLQELVAKNIRNERLHFITDKKLALENSQVCFIAVGTPAGANGAADLSRIFSVAKDVGCFLEHNLIIAIKSTVPVGTMENVRQIIQNELHKRDRNNISFDVVSNPEFLREGAAVNDFIYPNRVVIGTDNIRTAKIMQDLYAPFMLNNDLILVMDAQSAEITKYAANAMLATRISFINEIARLCDKVGADIASVRQGIGTDRRIGMEFLNAGVGYGGSCFPKDLQELIHTGKKYGVEMEIAQAVERVNERQKNYLIDAIRNYFGEDLSAKKFALWGLAFKPQTDDVREAPSIVIVAALLQMGATVVAYDPEAVNTAHEVLQNVSGKICFVDDMMDALDGAEALVLVTEWPQFKRPDFREMKRRLRQPLIFDGRNQYNPDALARLAFQYYCVGRGRHVN